jgi:hypothetical protein
MAKTALKAVENLSDPTDGGNEAISFSEPYSVHVQLQGTCDIIFHRWNAEAVEEKGRAAKNSAAKKTDNVESYVWRNEKSELCIPGNYLHGSLAGAAKFKQDPRSPRKSASDLYKAGIVVTTELASLGVKEWDYLKKGRVTVQRQGINRTRPAVRVGWRAAFDILVLTPQYIDAKNLREVIDMAGTLVGVGDYRPTYGRFAVVKWNVMPV